MKQVSFLWSLIICLCICQSRVNAQCDNTLVEKAASQSGADAVYLREFKVRFEGSERGKVVPVAKYPILLSRTNRYRFNVCNAVESEGKVILQLYLKDRLIGSTFDAQTTTDLQRFDFSCDKTATYEVVMSFDQGKPGCAVGILSLLPDRETDSDNEELDILYALADNPIMIYDDEDEFAEIQVSINNGTIVRSEGANYIIRPSETGTAQLSIRVMNRNGTLKEFKQKRFAVLALDRPYAAVNGIREGNIESQALIQAGKLELWFSEGVKCNYRIISFTLSDKADAISGISSNSARFSKAQRDFINNLPSGTRLYIKNIQASTADNVVTDIPSMELEIR